MEIDWEAKNRELAEKWGYIFTITGVYRTGYGVQAGVPDYANDLDALLRDMPAGWWLQFDRTTDGRCTAACGPPGTEENTVVEFEAERIEWALLDACLTAPE